MNRLAPKLPPRPTDPLERAASSPMVRPEYRLLVRELRKTQRTVTKLQEELAGLRDANGWLQAQINDLRGAQQRPERFNEVGSPSTETEA